ncbi:hypothetical protein [Methylocaldum szegediense]|uniref:hypothetical protein n=1 Tax=Methylocaldum szegediense TaxID=73780 RepID=UPI00295E8F1F|nr:hypothetical protein [Methylocaldum szegediense]
MSEANRTAPFEEGFQYRAQLVLPDFHSVKIRLAWRDNRNLRNLEEALYRPWFLDSGDPCRNDGFGG